MINLEEEARKRRERLKHLQGTSAKSAESIPISDESNYNSLKSSSSSSSAGTGSTGTGSIKRKDREEDADNFQVPEDQILLDESGAEILSLESKIPETLEAQAKALLSQTSDPTNILFSTSTELDVEMITPKNRNSDLKREYERRSAVLNRETRRSIVEIVKARIDETSQESEEKN